ncbi:nitrate- and nitrite sensing domain-containing protein [Streptomyces sp. DSM 44917]|uniref:histidine kinase n=1 Tax=Streptomyces boetiae TaxID=3075541 RepID=A0ABU2L3D0_9ACTN|nr:nitrate- and nitrite sensing domain-containing protein [Streptomyces sp. DSM 44917]MDT0306077.1 nitrate- and nitrite sensing domain-containing protein [Streptomyces sp. DSM 44917]
MTGKQSRRRESAARPAGAPPENATPRPARKGRRLARTRRGSIRLSLILLVVIPVCAMTALSAVGSVYFYGQWRQLVETEEDFLTSSAVTQPLRESLQAERHAALTWMATGGDRAALVSARQRTDELVAAYRAARLDRVWARVPAFAPVHDVMESRLAELDSTRAATDDGSAGRAEVYDQYTAVITADIGLLQPMVRHVDGSGDLNEGVFDLISMAQVAEFISRERALLTAATASRTMTAAERDALTSAVASRDQVLGEVTPELPADQRMRLTRIFGGDDGEALAAAERVVIWESRPEELPAGGLTEDTALDVPVLTNAQLRAPGAVEGAFAQEYLVHIAALLDLSGREAEQARTGFLTAAAIGLAGILGCGIVTYRITRSLMLRMSSLRRATLELARERLPDLIARLRRGDPVPEGGGLPTLDYGTDELGRVAQAFDSAQRTAVAVALEQAELREGARRMFLNMSRRMQVLLHRQLTVIDGMEHKATDPEDLADLYAVDHLATRMRRNAESLTILSGAAPGRRWRAAVALTDVLRSAVSEVENYSRVVVEAGEDAAVVGPAVADTVHLLAELIENGTGFSPPNTEVHVRLVPVAQGMAVEVEDRGLGMPAEELRAANELLAHPPEFSVATLGEDPRLGLIVVSHLAARHDITVTLRPSSYKGVLAVVLLPKEILDAVGAAPLSSADSSRTARHLAAVPRAGSGPRHAAPAALPAQPTGPLAFPTRPREDVHRNGNGNGNGNGHRPGGVPHGEPYGRPNAEPRAGAFAPPEAGPRARLQPGPPAPYAAPNGGPAGGVPRPPAPRAAPGTPGAPGGAPGRSGRLPRRVRMTHLAPQLRDAAPAAEEPEESADRAAAQARSVLTALQRGTRRALAEPPEPAPGRAPGNAPLPQRRNAGADPAYPTHEENR